MKQGNLVKWKDISACKNLLFFAQLVDELLFDYSIPSNRISTLNSHYLCLDALSAINGIDEHGVPEGTLKPIAEELYISLTKDPAFNLINNSPLRYFVKYQNERYRISMPYLALLVENLHSYVDDFLSYVIQGLSTGHDINSLCQELFAKECDWVADFSNRKAVMTDDVVTKMLSI